MIKYPETKDRFKTKRKQTNLVGFEELHVGHGGDKDGNLVIRVPCQLDGAQLRSKVSRDWQIGGFEAVVYLLKLYM
jgi:hypothetical protein